MPELAIHPGDPGDEAVGLDGAQDLARLGIDLMDLPVAILSHPQRALGPGHARVTTTAGCGDRREHAAGFRIDFVDAIFGDLINVLAIEGRSRMSGDIERVHCLAALGIEGIQRVSGRKPDMPAIIGDAIYLLDTWKGSIFTENFGG